MTVLASLTFGLLALFVLGNAVQSRRADTLVDATVPGEDREGVRRSLKRSARRNLLLGLCFTAASLLAWWSWPFALVLGGWPVVLFALLVVTGNVTVIRRLSTGE